MAAEAYAQFIKDGKPSAQAFKEIAAALGTCHQSVRQAVTQARKRRAKKSSNCLA
jgi:hypothetical protein